MLHCCVVCIITCCFPSPYIHQFELAYRLFVMKLKLNSHALHFTHCNFFLFLRSSWHITIVARMKFPPCSRRLPVCTWTCWRPWRGSIWHQYVSYYAQSRLICFDMAGWRVWASSLWKRCWNARNGGLAGTWVQMMYSCHSSDSYWIPPLSLMQQCASLVLKE